MYRHVLRSMALTAFAALAALPASAQVHADVGPLHIRIATEAPPRVRYERRPTRPDRDSVWIGGYWDRQGDQWAWSSGRWERPRDRNVRWIRPRYAREGRAWRYEPAHWSHEQLVEGDDYQRWKHEHNRDRDHDRRN
jgi:hypothetical protein